MRDVLHGALLSLRIFRPEVKRTEVDGVVGRSIDAVECDTEKALLLNVLTSNIKLDRPVGKLDSFEIRNAIARGFAEAGSGPGRICQAGGGPVKTP
jgi:hypothetical protein